MRGAKPPLRSNFRLRDVVRHYAYTQLHRYVLKFRCPLRKLPLWTLSCRFNPFHTLTPYFEDHIFFYLHSGGWNQGPLDTAAT
jgi:hypothetical protein